MILFTTAVCCLKQKSSSKVLFTKHEGTFKVIIDPSSNNEGPLTTQRSKMNDYEASIDSVTFTHNPSYSVSKLNEGLTESLYIDCSRLSKSSTDKVAEEAPFKKQEVVAGRNECENALYEARECKNALYETRECENTLYEARESENALYEAREYDNVLYADSVSITPNPSYHTPLSRSSSQNSYDYVVDPISEDLTQQITNTDIGINCNSTLYSMTLLEAATEKHGALYAVSDVPSTCSSMAIPSRPSSQNSYEYIAAQTFEESTHDYSLIDSAVV